MADTVAAIASASEQNDDTAIIIAGLRKQLADCERKLRLVLDEGADAATEQAANLGRRRSSCCG